MLPVVHWWDHTDWGPVLAAVAPTVFAGLAWVRTRATGRKVDQVHAEVRSPNGQTTAETVHDNSEDVAQLRREVAGIAVQLGSVLRWVDSQRGRRLDEPRNG